MTNKNLNGNQTTVDAGEEEKCRSVLPDGEKSASEGLLKAVSMRSPMPSSMSRPKTTSVGVLIVKFNI